MMKKIKLLVAMLALMVAASGFAQDSYRQALKEYLTASGQMEKSKSLITDFKLLFDKNGAVDIDQLTNRYLDEQYENDMLNFLQPIMTASDISEAELKEVSSLLALPMNKTFEDHQQEWMGGFLADFLMPFFSRAAELESEEDPDLELSKGGIGTLLGPPVEARADIDAAFAEKFKKVVLGSDMAKNMMDSMIKRFNDDDNMSQEDRDAFIDWTNKSMPNLMLNNAYGTLTLEDLDFAALLYSNQAYCKLQNLSIDSNEVMNVNTNVFEKYFNWMEEQGATKNEDPEAAMEFMKSLMNLSGVDLSTGTEMDDIDIEE